MRLTHLALFLFLCEPLVGPGCGVPSEHAERDTYPPIFVGDSMGEVRRNWGDPDSVEVFRDVPTGADVTTWRYDVRRGIGTETVTSYVRFRDGLVFAVEQKGPQQGRVRDLIRPGSTARHDRF